MSRTILASNDGRFSDEIIPVVIAQRRGEDLVMPDDEGVRSDASIASLAALRPAFSGEGTITAENAIQISDGAALVVMSRRVAERLGVQALAEIASFGHAAGPGTSLLTQPSRAIADDLSRAHFVMGDIDVIEVNEAFAAVAVASATDMGIPVEDLNPNGGAIALGHPIGMSGARLPLTLALELSLRVAEQGPPRSAVAEGSATRSFFAQRLEGMKVAR